MISEECSRIADINRRRHDAGLTEEKDFLPFPEGCRCTSMHRFPEKWEKMFKPGVIPPWKKILEENPPL